MKYTVPTMFVKAVLVTAIMAAAGCFAPRTACAIDKNDPKLKRVIAHGLDWIAANQSRQGGWTAQDSRYPTAMTALAGVALLSEGSTSTQGKYKDNIKRAVNYLILRSRQNGLIGTQDDDRYTYGHGYSMLFLSQVLGEEEDEDRRKELIKVLDKAVEFCGRAQTKDGGWGYVSAADGNDFDEGSTTITQVQGLRGCRNAGIAVPKEVVDKAIVYITKKCFNQADGGVQYSSKGGGSRPAISAAAVACLFNAGDYDDNVVPKLLNYCDKNLNLANNDGHWHYAHYYYSQVMYREGGTEEGRKKQRWEKYRDSIYPRLISEASDDGKLAYWNQGYIGTIYTTAVNLTILQLDNGILPIYQR